MKGKIIKYTVTLIVVALATLAAFTLYRLYLANPWTRDGQVRANVVGIAPAYQARLSALLCTTIRR